MKNIPVASRAHRALRGIPRFHFVPDETGLLSRYSAAVEANGSQGEIIGIYVNPIGTDPEAILVTDKELVVMRSGTSVSLPYSEIRSIQGPQDKQRDLDLRVSLHCGRDLTLRIAGADGQFRDIYSFLRFLDRVLEDRASD